MFPDGPTTSTNEVTHHLQSLRGLVVRLQPAAVPLPEAPDMWQAFNAIERLAVAAQTLLAPRVDESQAWESAGYRSAAEYLARQAGSSVRAARASVTIARRLENLPATAGALRRGDLSGAQCERIADAATVAPEREDELLGLAGRLSLAELVEVCGRIKATADPDPDATCERIHRNRRLRQHTDAEGAWHLHGYGTPEAGSLLNTALGPLIDELYDQARESGDHEHRDTYLFDALVELLQRAIDGHYDHEDDDDDLDDEDGEVCDDLDEDDAADWGDETDQNADWGNGPGHDDPGESHDGPGDAAETPDNAASTDATTAPDHLAGNPTGTHSGNPTGGHTAQEGHHLTDDTPSTTTDNQAAAPATGRHGDQRRDPVPRSDDPGHQGGEPPASGGTKAGGPVRPGVTPPGLTATKPTKPKDPRRRRQKKANNKKPNGRSSNKSRRKRRRSRANPRYMGLLRIDYAALARGHLEGDEVCEISGVGPISLRTALRLLDESTVKLVLTKGTDVAHVTHLGRHPTVAQHVALLWQNPGCTAEGCPHSFVQVDHRDPWANTRRTELWQLDRLCLHDHFLKTHHGWSLVEGTGKRAFVPPTDPRHPNHTRDPGHTRPSSGHDAEPDPVLGDPVGESPARPAPAQPSPPAGPSNTDERTNPAGASYHDHRAANTPPPHTDQTATPPHTMSQPDQQLALVG